MSSEFSSTSFSYLFSREQPNFEENPICCIRDWNPLYADQVHRKSLRDFWEIDVNSSNPQNVYELCWSFKEPGLDVFLKDWEDLSYYDACFWKKHLIDEFRRNRPPKSTLVFVFRDSENLSAPSFWRKFFPLGTPATSFRNVVPSRRTTHMAQPSGV